MANTGIKEWDWYQSGINYNNRLEPSYYDLVDCNWDFFYGFHWRNANLSVDYPQPVMNYINKYATFFVANILATRIGTYIESPVKLSEDDRSDIIVNQALKEFEERVKMDWQQKNALYDGVVTGDYVGHIIFDADAKPYGGKFSDVIGQLDFELVDPNNFYVGNPNSKDIQSQPWVQVAGRDMVRNLQEEAKQVAKNQSDEEDIQSDNDTEQQASKYGDIELEDIQSDDGKDNGKATYVITYTKKKVKETITVTNDDGEEEEQTQEATRVFATKCTTGAYIYKDIDLGVELYPVALGNWELQRNTYHGMSFVQAVIPTQIFINRGFAMAMKNTIDTSFPIWAYDKRLSTGRSNKVSTQVGLDLRPGEKASDIGTFIAPQSMSAQVIQMIELSKQYMAETVGANDALLGDINPEQASGVSIAAVTKQAGIPLENPKANAYNWREDITRIFLDQISHLYGERPVLVEDEEGITEVEMFDFDTLQGMYKTVKIEVGSSSYWSEIASVQIMDSLMDRGLVEFVDWLEELPEGYLKGRDKLLTKVKDKMKQNDADLEEFLQTLSPEEQQQFAQMTPEQQQIFEEERGA